MKLVVIDHVSGNLRSVAKALEPAGVAPKVTGDPARLGRADAGVWIRAQRRAQYAHCQG